MQRHSNNATTTLSAAITSTSATTLTVASASTFPLYAEFQIRIDSEIMNVVAVGGNTFTVERGAEGTTPATHTSGTPVYGVLTAYGLYNTFWNDIRAYGAVGDGVTDDTAAIAAALLDAGTGGTIYVPAGTWITAPITLRHKQVIRGAGWASVLKLKASSNGDMISNYIGTGAAGYTSNVTIDAPIAWWRMSANPVTNVVTGANNPTTNGPTTVAGLTTEDSLAMSFVGASSQFVDVAEAAVGWPTGSSARSVEFWFKTNVAAAHPIFTYGASNPFTVTVTSTGGIQVYWGASTATFGSGYANNATHHVVITYDGTNIRCYVDGTIVGSPTAATPGTNIAGQNVWIATNGSTFSTATIDEVALYSTALSSTRVSAHYNAGITASSGSQADAQQTQILDIALDGNKANQGAGNWRGIVFEAGTLDTEELPEGRHYAHNVFITNTKGDGVYSNSKESVLEHVALYKCAGEGFVIGNGQWVTNCSSGYAGKNGFKITGTSAQLVNCKAWFSGRDTVALTTAEGFNITSAKTVSLSSCTSQDNASHGFNITTSSDVVLSGCVADSNGATNASGGQGFYLTGSTNCNIQGIALDTNKVGTVPGTLYRQKNAVSLNSASTQNTINVIDDGNETGAVTGASVDGNVVKIDAQEGAQTVTYAASVVPDPYKGQTVRITLTGPITISATTRHHVGLRMTLLFTQDATGGRVVTFNSQYKTNWTPSTSANVRNSITFEYDGTNWRQIASATGLPA